MSDELTDSNNHFTGWAKEGYALITLPDQEKRIWTPQLNLQIDDHEEGSEVRGVIGPGASVWTAFAFTFSILGFIAFVSLFWGLLSLFLVAKNNWLFGQSLSLTKVKGIKSVMYKKSYNRVQFYCIQGERGNVGVRVCMGFHSAFSRNCLLYFNQLLQ